MSAIQACINQAAYNAFYDLAACALETHNPERAAQRIIEARDYLPQADVKRLVRELEMDYYEFT
ncbi:hypothetical protein BCO18175_03735 [Burkholderia contaminans]|uniref:hypothetical protein n=1 Tax=Burkholderia contaminans TaxID=488447 RepID=UPI001453EA31|nr:hypothetical protein [Burkholderia contaminans]VWC96318.1 hypothetical protein BCO18175_03735 [Burkholderia contaminans]